MKESSIFMSQNMDEQLSLLAKLNKVFSSVDDLIITFFLDGSSSVSDQ
jgi:hypothetical protein